MKKFLSVLLMAVTLTAASQPKKVAKMAPMLVPGYYVNMKGDTLRGEIQTNPDDETDFYRGFFFKAAKGGKPVLMGAKKAKAYGFDGKDFTVIPFETGEIYAQYLAKGRLNFMEYRMHEVKDGEPIIAGVYFIQDTKADDAEKELRDLKQISNKFYKRDIKPYMKSQPVTWTDLDKFTFDRNAVTNAIKEFNKYYE
ncbi:MAG: hypothetical protein V4635_12010 [Bacteroidota bacterium]